MSSRDANIIKILLGGILLLLLFSRDTVLRSLHGGFWIVLGLGALLVVGWLAWVFGKAFFYDVPAEYISDIRKEKAQGGPWLAGAVLRVGLPFGMAWIAGMMLHKWGWADIREYTEVAGQVWYVLMPTFLVLYTWSGLKKHYRSIPGAFAAGLKAFFQRWGYVAISPVLAPIGRIQEYKAQRAAGTFRGYRYATYDIVATFIVSIALWIFAVIVPLIIAAITYHEVFG
jgi:hypothetical protein